MSPVRTAARALLGALFVVSGARAVANPDAQVAKAKRVTDRLTPLLEKTDSRLPTETRTLVQVNGAAQLGAGLLFVTGHLTRPAAAVLAGTLVPTTIAGHPFWTVDDPAERRTQQTQFLKNLGLLGGLLLAAVDTQGKPGLAWRTSHAVDHARHQGRHSVERGQASLRRGQASLRRGQESVKRSARTARREARIAMRAAAAGRKLPG
jgi:putative oxidoreductase